MNIEANVNIQANVKLTPLDIVYNVWRQSPEEAAAIMAGLANLLFSPGFDRERSDRFVAAFKEIAARPQTCTRKGLRRLAREIGARP